MTSPFRATPLRGRAIELMKAGHTPEALHAQFLSEGANPEEVQSVLTELVALQQEAAAMDPERLRGEAKWMFLRGASVEDVVAHFGRVGVRAEHARPEAERVLARVRKLRQCQRCGTPTEPDQIVFDPGGFSICTTCNLRDEIGLSEQRGVARDLEAVGAFGGAGSLAIALAVNAMTDNSGQSQTTRPFCAQCKQPSGIHVAMLQPHQRARIDARWTWVCRQCWQGIN